MRVALAQIDCILGDLDENLRRAKEVVAEAKDEGADLVVFPELTLSGYALKEFSTEVAIEAQSEPLISLAEEEEEMSVVVGFCEDGRRSHIGSSAAELEGGAPLRRQREVR